MASADEIARPIRRGEELDVAALRQWLSAALPDWPGEVTALQFPKGYSNLTYLLRIGEREVVLRRPPFGSQVRGAHDMTREYRILRALAGRYTRIPKAVALCEDSAVLGAPFYLMERLHGVVLRPDTAARLDPPAATMRGLSEAFVDNLAEIHALDYRAAGLETLGRPQGYTERQVEGWTRRWQAALTPDAPDLEAVASWLGAHLPPEQPPALIHNDYKFDNLLLDPDDLATIRAVFDWEMATLGDPISDLGLALTYWVEEGDPDFWRRQAFGATIRPGSLTRRDLIARYASRTGRDISSVGFHYVLGCFKLAGILQQIYFRYRQGLTSDERFERLPEKIEACARRALLAMDTRQ